MLVSRLDHVLADDLTDQLVSHADRSAIVKPLGLRDELRVYGVLLELRLVVLAARRHRLVHFVGVLRQVLVSKVDVPAFLD